MNVTDRLARLLAAIDHPVNQHRVETLTRQAQALMLADRLGVAA